MRTDTCYFCEKEYEGYIIILCNDIECFLFEQNYIKEHYYDNEKHIGVCKVCREERIHKDPMVMWDGWLLVKAQLFLASSNAKTKGETKNYESYEKAIKRVEERMDNIESIPAVKSEFMKNNPAAYKEKPLKETVCSYCGENPGDHWINNPNGDWKSDNCWWVCKTCEEVIDMQQMQGMRSMMLEMKEFPDKSKDKIEEEYRATNDKLRAAGAVTFEIRKMESGYKANKICGKEE